MLRHVTRTGAAETFHQRMNIAPSSCLHLSVFFPPSSHPQRTISVRTSLYVRPLLRPFCHGEPVPRGCKCTVSSTEHIHAASCRTYIRDAAVHYGTTCLGRQMWRHIKDFVGSRPHQACMKQEHPQRRRTMVESL